MNKILIIGQAPNLRPQAVPYDTTLLYKILEWVGVSKEQAQDMFEFEALVTEFPGHTKAGGHKPPLRPAIEKHFDVLYQKADLSKRVISLGASARKEWARGDFFSITPSRFDPDVMVLSLPHPSTRCWKLIMDNKDKIITNLKIFINN